MAYGSNNPGGDDDYFNDGPKTEPKDMQKDGDQEEGLLPKSLMAGKDFAVGEEIVLKITGIQEKTFSVEYSYGDDKDKKDEGGDMPEKETADMGGGGGSEMESSMY